MKVESILTIEKENSQSIHLVRDSKFWQAWEMSAFYFHKLFRPFKISCRFFKIVSCDMVYLGFPDTLLDTIRKESLENGYMFNQVDESHIMISGLPAQGNFLEWKRCILASKVQSASPNKAVAQLSKPESTQKMTTERISQNAMLLAYREVYDYTLDICRRTGKFFRNYRFGLGDRLREESIKALEMMQLAIQNIESLDSRALLAIFVRARIEIRILLDLKQLSNEQWIFVNQKIERILQILRLEFGRKTTSGANLSEFSSPLTPGHV